MLQAVGVGGGGGSMIGLDGPLESHGGHHPVPHQDHNLISHTPSISSGASNAGGSRIKFVRLIRRRNESYGFSLRGGLEHGTGFFISHVETGSEAYMQGLRAGDQLLRVNNMTVDQAIHREVTAMVQSKSSVILKVKSAGIIPVKEHRGDPLTWLVVDDDDEEEGDASDVPDEVDMPQGRHLQGHHHQGFRSNLGASQGSSSGSTNSGGSTNTSTANDSHARVVITGGGKTGLGCSICKGPPEKPGIFVQSVRVGGVARNAGLRPGDQVLACNEVSFTHLEFAEAVYVLKSSPRLVLDVLRGAGVDFIAGESSGYNSSASSVAGDQTPPSSSSDPRDSDHCVTSRLSAVSHHLTIDRQRGWREIEAEWADAEAAEKRRQLQSAQRTLKTRAQRDANHRLSVSGSRSLSNLSSVLREEDDSEESTAFRDAGNAYTLSTTKMPSSSSSHLLAPSMGSGPFTKTVLRSTRSSSDVTDDTNHKIALVMSHDPHVNNIVVSGGPKDEKDAVSRLDQLSSPAASRTSTLSSVSSQVTVKSSSASFDSISGGRSSVGESPRISPESLVEQQLRELREEQKKLQEEANRLAEERRKFEEERRRGLERTQSAPLAPLVINCSGQSVPSHLQAPPSPTSSIASGRHTTRVLIKSPPPPPPPRKNTTTLTSRHQSPHPHQVSPPASPTHSSSSSSGLGSLCGSGAPPRRCKSIGSLSASSSESTVWEDLPSSTNPSHHHHQSHRNIIHHHHLSPSIGNLNTTTNTTATTPHSHFRSNMPPPPPPKPSAPLTSQVNTSQSQMLGSVPPPPPPPPPQPTPSNHQPSLGAALSKELERRQMQEAQSSANGDEEARAKLIQDKIDGFKKDKQKTISSDPKRAQHDKLMEEFKLAHKRMFVAKPDEVDEAKDNSKPVAKIQIHQKVTRSPASDLSVNSKIIDRLNQNMSNSKISNIATTSNSSKPNGTIVNGQPHVTNNNKSGSLINDGATSVTKWKDMLNSVPAASHKTNPSVSTKESQLKNEQSGGTNSKPSVQTKISLRPTSGNSIVMNEFRPNEKPSSGVTPPKAYFEVKRDTSSKPLVSIGTYPSATNRPTPVKMDFLPSTSDVNVEVNSTDKMDGSSTRNMLQNELTSTLTRSNIRQRLTAQEPPPDPPFANSFSSKISINDSSQINVVNTSFTTTTVHNNNINPSTTLSNKYKGIGQDTSSEGSSRNDEADSLPTGILKASGPATSIRPLQKSISFGDVTTVGEENWM